MNENDVNIDLKQASLIFHRALPFIWSMFLVVIAMLLLFITMSMFVIGLEGFWGEDSARAVTGVTFGYFLWRFTRYVFRLAWGEFDRSQQ